MLAEAYHYMAGRFLEDSQSRRRTRSQRSGEQSEGRNFGTQRIEAIVNSVR